MTRSVYYHLSPRQNRTLITRQGLCAEYARGPRKRVWVADETGLFGLLDHLAHSHGVPPADFDLWEVSLYPLFVRKTSVPGRYTVRDDVPPSRVRLVTADRAKGVTS